MIGDPGPAPSEGLLITDEASLSLIALSPFYYLFELVFNLVAFTAIYALPAFMSGDQQRDAYRREIA